MTTWQLRVISQHLRLQDRVQSELESVHRSIQGSEQEVQKSLAQSEQAHGSGCKYIYTRRRLFTLEILAECMTKEEANVVEERLIEQFQYVPAESSRIQLPSRRTY
jgi:hypothetical protein